LKKLKAWQCCQCFRSRRLGVVATELNHAWSFLS
jgi:hypothetical protein